MKLKFGYTIIYVENIEDTLLFYKRAFDLDTKFIAESKLYGELDTGNTILSFVAEGFVELNGMKFIPNRQKNLSPGFQISFISDDVEASYKKALEAGAVSIASPNVTPWGQKTACVKDINNIIIEICSPITY